jgi:hypothetical protein
LHSWLLQHLTVNNPLEPVTLLGTHVAAQVFVSETVIPPAISVDVMHQAQPDITTPLDE